jgi:methylsterol monooxygenase
VRRVLFNQFVVQLPVSFLLQPLLEARGIAYSAELPSAVEVVLHLLIFLAVEEVLFYYSHRALVRSTPASPLYAADVACVSCRVVGRVVQHLWNYQRIHKIHHEFRAPISIASEYAHPVEYVVSNMLPLLAGPLLMGSHLATVWVWTAIAVTGTSNHHCGYALPWLRGLSSPRFHDHHHLSFNTNFGLVGLLDHLHGTRHKPLIAHRRVDG